MLNLRALSGAAVCVLISGKGAKEEEVRTREGDRENR
jgi:hypothetical protein